MGLLDGTRRKAVFVVVTSLAPWANPHMERWGEHQQDVLVVDVVGKQRLLLYLLNKTGGWFYTLGEHASGETRPTGFPMPLGLSRSDGGQEVAGTFLARLLDTLASIRADNSMSDEERMGAKERMERLLALSK